MLIVADKTELFAAKTVPCDIGDCKNADMTAFSDEKAELFGIKLKSGETVGVLAIKRDESNHTARADVAISEPYRGKGYASDALSQKVYELLQNGVNRVYALHSVKNPAAGGVLRRIGMSYEGMGREVFYTPSGYHDAHFYGILKKDI